MSIGDFSEIMSQRIIEGTILVGRLGVGGSLLVFALVPRCTYTITYHNIIYYHVAYNDIHIYRERERERYVYVCLCVYIYIYIIYIYICVYIYIYMLSSRSAQGRQGQEVSPRKRGKRMTPTEGAVGCAALRQINNSELHKEGRRTTGQ